MYFCYAWCLVIYQDWFPKYLYSHFKVDLKTMGLLSSLPLMAGVVGDLAGGWASDRIEERVHNLKLARCSVAILGFLIAGAFILPATFASNPGACVAYTCVALFGLELTVGVSWAVPLDIGGDCAGSVSAVMNMCGNLGGLVSTTLLAHLVRIYGWNMPFLVAAIACGGAALLFAKIDPTKPIEATATCHAGQP